MDYGTQDLGYRPHGLSGRNPKTKATWNVESLSAAGNLINVAFEMKILKIGALGTSDLQWPRSGRCTTSSETYYSGNNDTTHRYGVSILIRKKMNNCVTNCPAYSEQIHDIKPSVEQINNKPHRSVCSYGS